MVPTQLPNFNLFGIFVEATGAISMNAISDLKANTSVPFEKAHAMPTAVYTDHAFLEAELSQVFSHDWFCVGRADALKNPGDYMTLELAGQPILVLRDNTGELRAMSNVCRHRMSTLKEAGCLWTVLSVASKIKSTGKVGRKCLRNEFCPSGWSRT